MTRNADRGGMRREHGLRSGQARLARHVGIAVLVCWVWAAWPAAAGQWRKVGPDAGDGQAIAFHPAVAGTVFVGMGDGLYRSGDGGASWTRIGLAGMTVTKVAVHPRSPAVIYAAAFAFERDWRPAVYRSVDGGATWDTHGPYLTTGRVWDLSLDPADEERVWLATDEGLLSTLDGGRSWHVGSGWLGPGRQVHEVVVDPAAPTTVYAVGIDSLFKSVDGGRTWTPPLDGPAGGGAAVRDLVLDPERTQTVYGIGANGILKSSDGGASWTSLGEGFSPYVQSWDNLTLAASAPASLLVDTDRGLHASSDGGLHWQAFPCTGSTCPWLAGTLRQLAFDPLDAASVLAVVDHGGVVASHDGGVNWAASASGVHNAYVTALSADPAGAVWAGTDRQGVFRSADAGQTWAQMMADAPLTACFEEGPCFRVDRFAHLTSPDRVVACTSWGGMVSRDGGASWQGLGGRGGALDVAQDPNRPDTLLLAAANVGMERGGLFLSTDGGGTWSEPAAHMGQVAGEAAVFIPGVGGSALAATWIANDSGSRASLLTSHDHGATWVEVSGDVLGFAALLPDPTRPGVILAATWRGVARSTDGGASWTLMNEGIPLYLNDPCPVTALVRDPVSDGTLYAASTCGVFASHDGAASWAPVGSGLGSADVRGLALIDGGRRLLAGTYGSGVWSLDLPDQRLTRRRLARSF